MCNAHEIKLDVEKSIFITELHNNCVGHWWRW